jgi:hypothetical protein
LELKEIIPRRKISVLPFYFSTADYFPREVGREKKLRIFLAAGVMVVVGLELVAG